MFTMKQALLGFVFGVTFGATWRAIERYQTNRRVDLLRAELIAPLNGHPRIMVVDLPD